MTNEAPLPPSNVRVTAVWQTNTPPAPVEPIRPVNYWGLTGMLLVLLAIVVVNQRRNR